MASNGVVGWFSCVWVGGVVLLCVGPLLMPPPLLLFDFLISFLPYALWQGQRLHLLMLVICG